MSNQSSVYQRIATALLLLCISLSGRWIGISTGFAQQPDQTMTIDPQRVQAAGLLQIEGKHVTLYTDLRDQDRTTALVNAFDAAVPQWCRFFSIDPSKATAWSMQAVLVIDRGQLKRFQQAGLIPDNLPNFAAGFQRDRDLWFLGQPGTYYTRHLLLHEGTHGFMQRFTGGYGAPWYSEGMAEMLAVHRWEQQQLTLRVRLRDREDAPYWGRVKLIREESAAGQGMTLDEVLQIPGDAFRNVRYYAWSWAGCEFFSRHPASRDAFAKLSQQTSRDPQTFNQQFRKTLAAAWPELSRDWALFIDEIEYGYEIERGILAEAQPTKIREGWKIQSDASWQQTSLKVQAGQRYSFQASGSYVVGQTRTAEKVFPWTSQPNGITIDYHRGRPLGRLQLGILQTEAQTATQQVHFLTQPLDLGVGAVLEMPASGILCFRINESPARLDDNQGALDVIVKRIE